MTDNARHEREAPKTEQHWPKAPRLYAFLFSIKEWIANWKQPCGENKRVRDWMEKANGVIENPKSQRRLVLFIVCIALFLDNMLYMVIVPIIPTYLREIHAFPTKDVYELVNITVAPNVTISPRITESGIADSGLSTVTMATMEPSFLSKNGTIYRSIKIYTTVYSENEEINIGVLFACKAIVQIFISPCTGTLMDRIGYDLPMLTGLIILFLSTAMFAFGRSYGVLFFARSLQGVGSAFADPAGFAMIADRFPEDKERSAALGISLACISFGCLVAPPFGGTLYEFAGKVVPFIVLSGVALVDGFLMFFTMKPVRRERRQLAEQHKLAQPTPIYRLILDPYVACCAGCLVMANVSLAFIEPTIALWMRDTMQSKEWQIGLIWLPAFIPHIAGVFITIKLAEHYPNYQWLMAGSGLAMEGISCMILPFCRNFGMLMIPLCILCFGIALVDTAILPLMAHIVDVRHVSVYGSVYAIADVSYCVAYAIGPIVAGEIVNKVGFTALNAGIFVSNILYAPLLFFLRRAYDYQKFVANDDIPPGDDDESWNLEACQTYTADCDDKAGSLEFDEQAINNYRKHPALIRRDSETSSEEEDDEEDAEADETMRLKRDISSGGLAGGATPQSQPLYEVHAVSYSAPTPPPRTASVSGVETNRVKDADYVSSGLSEMESDY